MGSHVGQKLSHTQTNADGIVSLFSKYQKFNLVPVHYTCNSM